MPKLKLRSTSFFLQATFISNTKLKLAKNEAKTKQETEAKLLTNISKNKFVCFSEIVWLNDNENNDEKIDHINKT